MVGIIDPLQKIKTKTSESAKESNVDNVDSLQGTIVLLHELELQWSSFMNWNYQNLLITLSDKLSHGGKIYGS